MLIVSMSMAHHVSYTEDNLAMDRTERFYKIDTLLQGQRAIPIDRLIGGLQVSRATFKRDLEYMRQRLNAPIEWDRAAGGYKYAGLPGERQELPGLWFNSSEAYALLMMQSLLAEMQPSLLGAHIEPLRARLRAVIESGQHPAKDVESRVRLLNVAVRAVPDKHFELVATALLRRVRLEIAYYGRGRNESSVRVVSPQLLIHYRGNWYLAAWCHTQNAMRSFAMDAIEQAMVLTQVAKNLAKRELQSFIGQGDGIFSGTAVRWAKLRFSVERARWVERELWHPQQRTAFDDAGRLVLELPFTGPRELTMDILRHGQHVEVLEPADLRLTVQEELRGALGRY